MNRYSALLDVAIAAAERDAAEAEADAADAFAFFASEPVNRKLVDDALAALQQDKPNVAPILSARVISALAALSEPTRRQTLDRIKDWCSAKRRLERSVSVQELKRRLTSSVQKIEAARKRKTDKVKSMLVVDASHPTGIAVKVIETRNHQGQRTILRWNGTWWVWKQTHYEQVIEEYIRSLSYAVLDNAMVVTEDGPVSFKPRKKIIDDVVDAMKATAAVGASTPPCWLRPDESQPKPRNTITFANGILDVERWVDGNCNELIPHSPGFFNLSALPFNRDPEAKCPLWKAFVKETFEADERRILALRCTAGLLMTPDTSYQKIWLIIGRPRSGKGTVLRVLGGLLGTKNMTTPRLGSLVGEFGLSALVGKSFAAFGDVHSCGRDAQQAVEILLGITGEDSANVNIKHKAILTDVRLTVRVALTMNEPVRLPDAMGAVASRLVVLPFNRSVAGKEDPKLTDKLLAELPGIANWALEGLRILRQMAAHAEKNGKTAGEAVRALLQAPIGEMVLQEFHKMCSPLSAFLDEECVVGEQYRMDKGGLYNRWKNWCERNGCEAGSSSLFHSRLRGQLPGLKETRPDVFGGRIYMYEGIADRDLVDQGIWRENLKREGEAHIAKLRQMLAEMTLSEVKQ
jgi:putative DNA primase/helicase